MRRTKPGAELSALESFWHKANLSATAEERRAFNKWQVRTCCSIDLVRIFLQSLSLDYGHREFAVMAASLKGVIDRIPRLEK